MTWAEIPGHWARKLDAGDPIDVEFIGTIRLLPENMAEVKDDVAQAIQNVIGASGAKVVEVTGDA